MNKREPKKVRNILPNIQHHIFSNEQPLNLEHGLNTYSTVRSNVDINFYAHKKALTKRKLIIMLSGSSKRNKSHLDFQRYTWSNYIHDYDVISFPDPTLKPTNDIKLAWYQYNKDNYGLKVVCEAIKEIAKTNDYCEEDIILFGSSGGGFAALQLANLLTKSQIIAINPQIYLYNYQKKYYQAMIVECFQGMDHQSVFKYFKERIALQIDFVKRNSGVYIFQNTTDTAHMVRHLKPFLKSVKQSFINEFDKWPTQDFNENKLNIIFYTDETSLHSPPAMAETLEMLTPIIYKENFTK